MRLALVCVGRLKAGPERELFDRYFKRTIESARGVGISGVDLREIDESRARRPEDRREEEAAAIAAALPAGAFVVALDERDSLRPARNGPPRSAGPATRRAPPSLSLSAARTAFPGRFATRPIGSSVSGR